MGNQREIAFILIALVVGAVIGGGIVYSIFPRPIPPKEPVPLTITEVEYLTVTIEEPVPLTIELITRQEFEDLSMLIEAIGLIPYFYENIVERAIMEAAMENENVIVGRYVEIIETSYDADTNDITVVFMGPDLNVTEIMPANFSPSVEEIIRRIFKYIKISITVYILIIETIEDLWDNVLSGSEEKVVQLSDLKMKSIRKHPEIPSQSIEIKVKSFDNITEIMISWNHNIIVEVFKGNKQLVEAEG